MSQTSHIEEIRADLACPQCQYNLRGLQGEVVTCPECGVECDVAQLIARRWDKPWYQAPGFNRVLIPGAWLYLAALFGGTVLIFLPPAIGFVIWIGGGGGVFVALLWSVRRWWGGNEGLWLALLPVVLTFGYLGSVIGAVTSVVSLFEGRVGGGILLLLICIAVAVLCRRGERFIAGRCIKHYLAQAAPQRRQAG